MYLAFKAPRVDSDERLWSPESRVLNLGKFWASGCFQTVTSILAFSVAFESEGREYCLPASPAALRGQSRAAPQRGGTMDSGGSAPSPTRGPHQRRGPARLPAHQGQPLTSPPEVDGATLPPLSFMPSAFENCSCSSGFSSARLAVFKIAPGFRSAA